jgi:hypothetical protein
MLNITAPQPVQPSQRPEESAILLKLNQRIAAEVLQVTGDNVMLAIDGVRFVARLTTADQAAALLERRYAQFIIRDINPNQILIQLAPTANQAASATAAAGQDLTRTLLAQMGLPATEGNLQLLRVMLARGLPVNRGSLAELQTALNQLGAWGSAEAQAAASLKSAGLPISPATLALVMNAPQETLQSFSRLLSLLEGLSLRQVSPQAGEALQRALASMHQSSLEWTGNSSQMAESLRQVVQMLGHSIESNLAELASSDDPRTKAAEQARTLMDLITLRRELARSGPREVVEAIDRFVDSLRLQHFQSSERDPAPGRSDWININLPLHLQPPEGAGQPYTAFKEAHLRIACQGEGENRQVQPNFTRFVITVDLDKHTSIEVDLSVVEKKIGLQVIASNTPLCNAAKEELPSFTQGLSELGFDLQTSRFEIGTPQKPRDLTSVNISPEKYLAIDMEV